MAQTLSVIAFLLAVGLTVLTFYKSTTKDQLTEIRLGLVVGCFAIVAANAALCAKTASWLSGGALVIFYILGVWNAVQLAYPKSEKVATST